jgi:1-deoxy-D-xylulose-5-phosphate synthase
MHVPEQKIACLVVAAGRGTRARQADGVAKQYQHIGAVPVLTRTLRVFASHPRISAILVVFHPDDRLAYDAATQGLRGRLLDPVPGGATRQDSVRMGLEALAAVAPDIVLVHDAARPFLRHDLVDRVLAALCEHAGAIPALPVADTLKRNAAGMLVGGTVARNGLYRAQTPQGFRFEPILAAHRAAAAEGRLDFTDDAAVAEWRGMRIAIVEGAEINRKLTTAADIAQADREFRDGSWDGQERRSGMARAVVPLAPGDRIRLLGATLPWRHADARPAGGDRAAAAGALALLRAARLPDADVTLPEAGRRVREAGGGIASVDLALFASDLRLDGQRDAMRAWIADALAIEPTRVGLDVRAPGELGLATTQDELALVAHAVVTMPEALPAEPSPQGQEAAIGAGMDLASTGHPPGMPLLSAIRAPADLHALPERELPRLAAELRGEVAAAALADRGHPGPAPDVAELTVALHRVFDPLRDRLVLGHGRQSRPHAILASRYGDAAPSRAGAAQPGEAHTADPISAGLGKAVARDLRGDGHHVVCVIGDDALSAGMTYEALNGAGMRNERLVVILADSGASIAEPVGAVTAYLARLSSSSAYFRLRDAARQLARRLPRRWERRAARAEEMTRTYWTGGTLFEELGFHHVGPIDGHDFAHLLPVLRNVRDADAGPILVHVVTRKTDGLVASNGGARDHGAGGSGPAVPAKATEPGVDPELDGRLLAEGLADAARRDPSIVAVAAALPPEAGFARFGAEFPGRSFDAGIAVQHAVSLAAGLAMEGLKPFLATSSAALLRGHGQVVHDVARQRLPVRLCILGGGHDAPGLDIASLGCIPGMTIMAASDEVELRHMVATQAALDESPSALRVPRGGGALGDAATRGVAIAIGRGRVLREGGRVALLSIGTRLAACLEAAATLAAQGVSSSVADARFVIPLDEDLVRRLARDHELLVTVEEGSISGFGSLVLHFLAREGLLDGGRAKVRTMVLPDRSTWRGPLAPMDAGAGLDAPAIVSTVLSVLGRHREPRLGGAR